MTATSATPPSEPPGDVASSDRGPSDFVLGPATRMLWRSPDAIHLQLGDRAVIVEGLPGPVITHVASSAPPRRTGPPPVDAGTGEVLAELSTQGYLWSRPHDSDDPRLVPPTPRLTGELTALAARHGEQAAELLNARRHASVVVFGHGRVGVHLAAVLASAGVGRVRCVLGGPARLVHTAPGGILPSDEGGDLQLAATAALLRAAPEVDTAPLSLDERPDLTVLALDAPFDEDRRATLHADGAAHLVVTLGPDRGVVGPLVLPGLSSCLRCADLHRRDRDPAWPALAAQLTVPRRYGTSSEIAVETVVAGAAAMQALAFLDGESPGCVDATLELLPPDWRLRRRSWTPHPSCDCGPVVTPHARETHGAASSTHPAGTMAQ